MWRPNSECARSVLNEPGRTTSRYGGMEQQFDAGEWAVPDFSVTELKPRSTRYAVVIPVINEGDRIRGQLRRMSDLGLTAQADTLVVDGGSTDGSLAQDFLRSVGVRALLVKTGPGKLSAQLRCGYAWALREGYEGIITIDGNGKDGVETIPDFLAALDDGYGYVQASRFIRGGRGENTPPVRLLAIRLLHAPILSLAARKWLTDTTQGYRAYSREYLLHPGVQPFRAVFDRYELLAYLTVRASQLGFKVKELPTTRTYPKGEKIPTKISGLRGQADLMATLMRASLGTYHPGSDQG
jgi:dolichol-phosphate mannosyltransferase